MVLLQRKLYFSKDLEGVQHFPGGGGGGGSSFFWGWGGWGGFQMLISIATHSTCVFPERARTPIPPLDPHMFTDHRPTQDTVME